MALGRKPDIGVERDIVVCVRFSKDEAAHLDAIRGTARRSTAVRSIVAAVRKEQVE